MKLSVLMVRLKPLLNMLVPKYERMRLQGLEYQFPDRL